MTGPTRSLASWLDLFYDLVLVATIVVLSNSVAKDLGWTQAAWSTVVLVLIWLAWVLTTLAAVDHPVDDFTWRALLVLQMLALTLVAVAGGDGVDEHAELVGIFYAFVLVALAAMFAWRHRQGAPLRSSTIDPRLACLVGVVAFPASGVLPTVAALVVWLAAMAVLLVAALGVIHLRAAASSVEHPSPADDPFREQLVERFGALTIIVLGESFVKIALTAANGTLDGIDLVVLPATFVVVFALWWTYFGGLAAPTSAVGSGGWVIGHLVLHVALVALAVGSAELLLPDTAQPEELLLALPLAVAMVALAYLQRISNQDDRPGVTFVYLGFAVGVVIIGVLGRSWGELPAEPLVVTLSLVALGCATAIARLRGQGAFLPKGDGARSP